MMFLLTYPDRDAIFIRADVAYNALSYAATVFHASTQSIGCSRVDDDISATVEVEMRGTDAGRVADRFLWVRTRRNGRWSKWRRA